MPMCSTASGVRSARARAVCSAASTGPIPHTNVSKRRDVGELALGRGDDEHARGA